MPIFNMVGGGGFKERGQQYIIFPELPYKSGGSELVELNGEIHMLGGKTYSLETNITNHYKWDGESWTKVSTLPYGCTYGHAVVYNNEIHIIWSYGSDRTNQHYKWDGSAWTSVSILPENFYNGSAVVYNNEIHAFGYFQYGYNHYKWDGSSWTKNVSSLPYDFMGRNAVVYNNEIHIFGYDESDSKQYYHYKWDGESWTKVSTLPNNNFYNAASVVYRGEIHVFGCVNDASQNYAYHYKWDGASWTKLSDVTYNLTGCGAVVLNDYIHLLGANSDYLAKKHCMYGDIYTKA